MRFFSKIVFLCNLCFVAVVLFRWIELTNKQKGHTGEGLTFQPLVSTLAILGYGAIIFNLLFCVSCLLMFIFKRPLPVVKWLIWINVIFLLVQGHYFKLY